MLCIVIYCRAGFENDAAAEITHHTSGLGIGGYVKAKPNSALVVFHCFAPEQAQQLIEQLAFARLVFARQWFVGQLVEDMGQENRVSPLVGAALDLPKCGELRVETPDTNESKALSTFCKKITTPLSKALEKQQKLTRQLKPNLPVLHILFLANDSAYIGYSLSNNNSPFFMGIPRLRMPKDAPSRSTLKLDEAFNVFLSKEQQAERLQAGMRGVDLGACPGGWTYQLVRRGLFVQAVDNGAMNEQLMETGQVKHFTQDGFKFRPERRNIHWLVCDMVEKPAKVTQLMLEWGIHGYAKEFIFNLKLPMKKRFECVYENLNTLHQQLQHHGIDYQLQAKHLYHDREEITVHLYLKKVPQHLYS